MNLTTFKFRHLLAATLAVFSLPDAMAEVITPSTISSSTAASDFFPAANLIDGSGLSATPTDETIADITHALAAGSNAWVTDAAFPTYFDGLPNPILTFTLSSASDIDAFAFWGYQVNGAGDGVINEARSFQFTLKDAAGTVIGSPVTRTFLLDATTTKATVVGLPASTGVKTIELEILDNYSGDRVGLGEMRFLNGLTSTIAAGLIDGQSLSVNGGVVQLVFDHIGGATPEFEAEYSENLSDWDPLPGATFTPDGAVSGRYTMQANEPANPTNRRFFRVLLDDSVVATFGDEPLTVTEGANGSGEVTITLNSVITGRIPMRLVLADGTSFEVIVDFDNQSSVVIDLSGAIENDLIAEGARFATFEVLPDLIGGGITSVVFEDDDEIWDGVFKPENGPELTFCFQRSRNVTTETVTLMNPKGDNFFPVGSGQSASPTTFTETTIDLSVESAALGGEKSPFGIPLQYQLSLVGAITTGEDAPIYEGTATLTKIYDNGLTEITTPDALEKDAFDNDTDAIGTPRIFDQLPGEIFSLTIDAANDDDFYRIPHLADGETKIEINFSHAVGDLDLEVLDAAGARIQISESTANSETITLAPPASDTTVTIRVFGFSGATNAYSLFAGPPQGPRTDTAVLSDTREGVFSVAKRPQQPKDNEFRLEDAP